MILGDPPGRHSQESAREIGRVSESGAGEGHRERCPAQ